MIMEVVAMEEVIGSSNNDHVQIVKGKRTKRQRPSSPLAMVGGMMTTSNSSSGGDQGDVGFDGNNDNGIGVIGVGGSGDPNICDDQLPTTSTEELVESTTEEEEDMANCLILLAQGYSLDNSKQFEDDNGVMEKFNSRRFTEAPTTTTSKAGYYVYQCKTCSRCFPSFQALGGHRASHKKPKSMVGEKKTLLLLEYDDHSQFNNNNNPSLNLQMGNRATTPYASNKSKVHECSICGSEFSSGQALGGHMRRHRTSTTANMTSTTSTTMDTVLTESHQEPTNKKSRNVLSLDLNLPAPEEDRESKFATFASKQQPLVFSTTTSLVDCHY
ncbi:hypothetical protein AQUCO_01900189v1 [Aquilegia coerulea]|uniref:C2H2-type domain-containing protein n=1 Tax=Aquilegia coerulea TaxID=218851 RepID=A0A2G5DJA6_AQUCA|nr:hypothetical protein AQUCO_01900189v1 [Aquilegia coerulea]